MLQGVRASDAVMLLWPLVVGLGFTRLVTPNTYRQCGIRPALQPPGWVFAVAWTVLYAITGVAGFLAWRRSGRRLTAALTAFVVAIVYMMLWWVVFSNVCTPRLAFAGILTVLAGVAAAAVMLLRAGARAPAALMAPLLGWLCFASYLTYKSIP